MINDKIAEKVKNGAVLPIPEALQEEKDFIVMESTSGQALAIYIHHPEKPGMMKPSKVLRTVLVVIIGRIEKGETESGSILSKSSTSCKA